MKTLAITNQKGGVAKTTTAVTLSHGLALRGYKVLLVDLDAQGNVADALGLEKRNGLHELLFGDDPITDTGRENLAAVLGDHSTAEAKSRLMSLMMGREQALKRALAKLTGYDVCVLDTAPGVDILQIGALVACTHFIIPVALDHLAVIGAGDALTTTASLQELGNFRGRFLGVLPTMWERSTRESHEQLESIVTQFRSLVWPPIPQDVKAREAPSYGETLWEYASKTRAIMGTKVNGKGTVGGYRAVLDRLVKELGL